MKENTQHNETEYSTQRKEINREEIFGLANIRLWFLRTIVSTPSLKQGRQVSRSRVMSSPVSTSKLV